MAKNRVMFVCRECGYESGKWYGKCPSCGEWDSLDEMQVIDTPVTKSAKNRLSHNAGIAMPLSQIDSSAEMRLSLIHI